MPVLVLLPHLMQRHSERSEESWAVEVVTLRYTCTATNAVRRSVAPGDMMRFTYGLIRQA